MFQICQFNKLIYILAEVSFNHILFYMLVIYLTQQSQTLSLSYHLLLK